MTTYHTLAKISNVNTRIRSFKFIANDLLGCYPPFFLPPSLLEVCELVTGMKD